MAGMGSPTPSRATLNASYTLYPKATLLLSDSRWTAPLGARHAAGLLRRGAAFQWVGDPDALLLNGACASCGRHSHSRPVACTLLRPTCCGQRSAWLRSQAPPAGIGSCYHTAWHRAQLMYRPRSVVA